MSNTGSSTASPTSGRPRNREIDNAVLAATLEILDRVGYPGLTMEEAAKRAGTSRPAIYRRWPNRARMALAAIATRLDVPTPPDTGCTICDFGEALDIFLTAYRTIRPDVLSSLYTDCAHDDELKQQYMDIIIDPPYHAVGITLDRAIDRGHVRADVDRVQLLDMLASLVHYRALFGNAHITDDEAEKAIVTLLRGAAVDYDALVEHSKAMEEEHEMRMREVHQISTSRSAKIV